MRRCETRERSRQGGDRRQLDPRPSFDCLRRKSKQTAFESAACGCGGWRPVVSPSFNGVNANSGGGRREAGEKKKGKKKPGRETPASGRTNKQAPRRFALQGIWLVGSSFPSPTSIFLFFPFLPRRPLHMQRG